MDLEDPYRYHRQMPRGYGYPGYMPYGSSPYYPPQSLYYPPPGSPDYYSSPWACGDPSEFVHGQKAREERKVEYHYVEPGERPKIRDGHIDKNGVEHRTWQGLTKGQIDYDNYVLAEQNSHKTEHKPRAFGPKDPKPSECFYVFRKNGERELLPYAIIDAGLKGAWQQNPYSGQMFYVCEGADWYGMHGRAYGY